MQLSGSIVASLSYRSRGMGVRIAIDNLNSRVTDPVIVRDNSLISETPSIVIDPSSVSDSTSVRFSSVPPQINVAK